MARLRSQQSEWQPRYQHQHIGLFGSTARNEATASNDLVRLRVNPALWNTEE
jgi:predicted nucleotidyltransferase